MASIGAQQARDLIAEAYEELFPGEIATLGELQAVQAVARAETFYGQGWKGAGVGSNNWGAVQTSCENPNSFSYQDTHPTGGGDEPYPACFRVYPSPYAGALDLTRLLLIKRPKARAAAQAGDLYGFSRAMLDSGYYEGPASHCADKSEAGRVKCAQWHAGVMQQHIEKIAAALNEHDYFAETKKSGGTPGGTPEPGELPPAKTSANFPTLAVVGGVVAAIGLGLALKRGR